MDPIGEPETEETPTTTSLFGERVELESRIQIFFLLPQSSKDFTKSWDSKI